MAIEIPTIDETHVASTGYDTRGSSMATPDEGLTRATEKLSRGVDEFGRGFVEMQARNQREKEKADEIARRAKEKADEAAAAGGVAQAQAVHTNDLYGDSSGVRGSNPIQPDTGTIDLTQPQTPFDPGAGVTRDPNVDPRAGVTRSPNDPGVGVTRDPNADSSGFLATRGMNASAASGDTWKAYQKQIADIRKGLANPEQQAAFDRHVAELNNSFKRKLEEHVHDQNEVADQATVKSLEEQALVSIRNDYKSLDTAKTASAPVEALRESRNRPLGTAAVIASQAEWRSKVDMERLKGAMTAGNWEYADALFGEVKDQLSTRADREGIQKAIQAGVIGATSDSAAQKIVDSTLSPESQWGDPIQARIKVDAMPDGPLKEAVRAQVEHRIDREAENKKQFVVSVFDRAVTALQKAGGNLAAISPADKIALQNPHNDPTPLADDPSPWEKIEDLAHKYVTRGRERHAAKSAHETPEEAAALVELKADIARDPDKYKAMSTEEFQLKWINRLSESGYKSGGGVYATNLKDKPEKAAEFARFVKDSAAQSPAIATDKTKAARYAAWMGAARQQYIEDNKGKEPDFAARQQMQADATATVVLEKNQVFPDKKGPRYETALPGSLVTKDGMPVGFKPPKAAKGLAPGRYTDKGGRVWIVDAAGNKRAE